MALIPKHLGRYTELARLLMKYGRSDLVKRVGLEEALLEEDEVDHDVPAEASGLAEDLEKLGPTYIKLGQLLSTRSDFLPPAYVEALSRLQDDVEPFPVAEVEAIIEEELGVRMSKLFARFDREPVASASLGQVHRAALRDGREVAVKVQRPGIRPRIQEDLDALAELADFLDKHMEAGRRYAFGDMLEQLRRSLMRELDYRQEAANLHTFVRNLAEFERILVPEPIDDYSTSRVLTMEYVRGRKITKLSPLARIELDGEALAEELFRAYLKQILVDGVFHADPHPGNVFLTEDHRIALIDLGMVGRIGPAIQEKLLKLLLAVADGRGEDAAEVAIALGTKTELFEERAYVTEVSQLVAHHKDSTMAQIDVGRVVVEITRAAGENGLRLPAELTLLGKTLLNLDKVSATLAPAFDHNAAIRRNASDLMQRRMLRAASPTSVFSNLLEMNDFVQRLPGRLNKVLDRVADNELALHVDAIDEKRLIAGLEKIANRITLGLILAALIIGAAMLMRVQTDFIILGYPGLAMLFFIGAAIGGVWLAINILRHDQAPPED
jgi:predicted unusual protein kinase regulating ubiquinone biosynthesis (AarF/ABC1/UbiB family)